LRTGDLTNANDLDHALKIKTQDSQPRTCSPAFVNNYFFGFSHDHFTFHDRAAR
jgi:hypothetical protein